MATTSYYAAYEPTIAWWFPAAGLIFVAIGFLFLAFSQRRLTALVVLGFAIIWTIYSAVSMLSKYRAMRLASQDPGTPVAEGVVRHFQPQPPEGHRDESFEVDGISFTYSSYVITGGYNRTASHGGIIREGLPVRIRYVRWPHRNVIVAIDTTGS